MEDDAMADHLEPNDDSDSETHLERVVSGQLHGEAGKRRGDITLAELQEQFARLQHEFEIFQEGRTRPPTRSREHVSAAPVPPPRQRSPRAVGRADGEAGRVPAADGPRSQSVPPGGRMLRNPSPADGRLDQMRVRQPSAQPPPRASRPPPGIAANPAAGAAASAPSRPRPVSERRLPSPPPPHHPRSASKAPFDGPGASPAAGHGKPPAGRAEKKLVKKKVERPPWRDDFAADSSPWSRELAQEEAAAAEAAATAAADSGAAVGCNAGGGSGMAIPRAPDSGRGRGDKERAQRWRTGGSSDGGGRDRSSSPVPAVTRAESPGAPDKGVPAQARRRPQPAAAANARAAAVAAAMEAGRQQQMLEQHQQGTRQQQSKGGMLLVIPSGPGAVAAQQGSPQPGSEVRRISPCRASQIPTSPSPGLDVRPRTQQSRIPTFPSPQRQQQQQHQQLDAQGDGGRWQSGPGTSAALNGIAVAAIVDRLVVDSSVSSSFSYDDPLSTSAESSAQTPPSNACGNPHQQRRRRQWEVPGGAAAGSRGTAAAAVAGGDANRRVSSPEAVADAVTAQAAARPPPAGAVSPAAVGRVYNPTPPSSRPPSRPGSRPGSRPTSSTGEATAAGAIPPSIGHHPPLTPMAYTEQDARQHSSPERPTGHRVSSAGARHPLHARGGGESISEVTMPDVTFAAGFSGGGCTEDQTSVRQAPPLQAAAAAAVDAAPGAAAGLTHAPAAIALVAPGMRADLNLPEVVHGGGAPGVSKTGTARGPGPGGPRDKEDYFRKLSALKRSVPNDPLRRVTEDGGNQAAAGAAAAGSGGGAGCGSAAQSRKWMDPGTGDASLSAAPMDAVGSAPAAVRAARSRNLAADVLGGIARSSGGCGDAADGGEDVSGDAAAGWKPRPGKGRSQLQLQRLGSGSMGDVTAPASAGPALGGAAAAGGRTSESGYSARAASQAPQYMAFAVQNPEVAMAAAQAAINANGSRARARWNVPPPLPEAVVATAVHPPAPPGFVAAAAAAVSSASPPPWVHSHQPPAPPPPPPQQHHQLAAAMVSSTSTGSTAVPLVCSPGQAPQPNLGAMHSLGDNHHDLRRANSEGPRLSHGRDAGSGMLEMAPPSGALPTSAPSGPGPGGLGGLPPPPGGPYYVGAGHLPPPQGPIMQGLFPVGSNVGAMNEGALDGSGRLPGFGPAGGPYTSPLQHIRPAMVPPGEMWAGGPGAGPGPPPHMHMAGFPPPPHPPPHWNGYGYGQGGGRPPGYLGPGAALPGTLEGHGPLAHTGPIADPYKPQLFKRNSNGHYDGFGGAGLGYASAPPGASGAGPSYSSGGGAAASPDLPDYLRVSMSRMVAGWSAPNAKHGALSGFNDVWQHRNNSRPPAGPGMAVHGSGGVPGPGPSGVPDGGAPVRGPSSGGGGGGGGRETGFEGLSLEAVLASKPKKEMPNFTKKT
ncbi:hypothetical protein VOLCADRAFT_88236 [Volvox carteri f. nagariensis]|uniref:Uncharacterized protein n=1 Tax=Volvox carteri f. nagariensis TaxID=3068 RepID=D8TNM9_VOLCA|nr:uncharacterized protein VOLCADRAFT_88236 [Volvox carteri f. nagariensis]EFJ51019.1 hypothetical protein VOLCADRAFT_88236 [Volvox carteri f. nagariensis]|eukprot:XP_002948031.1 hypothetical protein VOLCADRAFT_88236 [Volvox carteri f. nagariensis]